MEVGQESLAIPAPLGRGEVSLQQVLQAFRKQENRADVEEMLSWYKWTGPQLLHGKDVLSVVSYCDFKEGSETTVLTERGEKRSLAQVANNYLEKKEELPQAFREKVERYMSLIRKGENLPPCFILEKPFEFYNGQIVDGVHRLVALSVCVLEDNRDYQIQAYVGHDQTPLSTYTRWARNALKYSLGVKNY